MLNVADLGPPIPPPQSVVNKQGVWKFLVGALVVCFVLRLIACDISGALITALLVCFTVVMLRDGMRDLGRYAVVFALLTLMNLVFDLLPLFAQLSGRTTSHWKATYRDGGEVTYTPYTLNTPFFDLASGFLYNVQSLAMLISPLCMLLGTVLAIHAHIEFQRNAPALFEDDLAELFMEGPAPRETTARVPPRQSERPQRLSESGDEDGGLDQAASETDRTGNGLRGDGSDAVTDRRFRTYERFHGQGYKLGG